MRKLFLFSMIFCTVSLAQQTGARYLIITHDDFYDAIQPLAQWKHKKGMSTKVVKLSEIGSDSVSIRNYIVDAYNNWQIPPEFLLLVGAPNYIPFSQINFINNDNYYTNMDGDIYNEILSGRLTVHNTGEAENVVNKMLSYERTPYTQDSLWFINACLIVRQDYDNYSDSVYWSDAHHAKDLMLQNGYNTIDTLCNAFGDDKYDIIDCVDSGRAFVLYRGQGVNNWWSPFDVDPNQTNNDARLPIVLSLTCCTIGTGSSPAVAEGWFLTGSTSNPRGASGYFATTIAIGGGAHLRSAVCTGFFDAIFSLGKRTFGEACEVGRLNVYDLYGADGEYRGNTTIGDPEMNIWTAIPRTIEVLHDSLIDVSSESLYVKVNLDSAPFESALVCVILDTMVYQYGYTTNLGEITFHFDSLGPGFMSLTVTGKNIIPYEDSINISANAINEENSPGVEGCVELTVYPSPCRGNVKIRCKMQDARSKNEESSLKIYDVSGRVVKSFNLASDLLPLTSAISWDGTDGLGRKVAEGVYFISFKANDFQKTEKVILLK